jgi:hypothetical protein
MKFKILILLIVPLLIGLPLMAAESNYDESVTDVDFPGKLTYKGTVTFSDSGSGDAYYTQAFSISGVADAYGYGRFVCSEVGTEDVNVFVEYSIDKTTWTAGTTDSDLDAVGTTAVNDTIGIVQGSAEYLYQTYPYARLKFVAGQAINATTMTWSISFNKDSGLANVQLGRVSNRGT